MIYDAAIIGTGPAGLEAAITAKVRNKNVLLIGSRSLSSKVEKAHAVQNYLGLPAVTGEEMQNAFLKHIDEMGIKIRLPQYMPWVSFSPFRVTEKCTRQTQ